jgi:hypothetical protein
MFGIFLDVTQRKQAEEANELLAGEMSHRVKNLLTIATALTQITSRSAATKEDMAHELTSRLIALGRAQDLIRPVPGRKSEATLLGDLVSVLLAPYDEKGASVRIRVSVPKMNVGETSSTALALVIHELATNSAKIRCAVAFKWHPGCIMQRPRGRSGGYVDRAGWPACRRSHKAGRLWKQVGAPKYGRPAWRHYSF